MKKKVIASVIVRTKNEEKWIDICLGKVFEQKKIPFEVILIDNNSNDKTVDKAKKYPIRIFKIKKFLPGKAINLGTKKALGKYIVCLSAHCIPENNLWLFNLIKNLKGKKVAAVYGKQKPLPYSSSFDKRDLYNTFGDDKRVQKNDTFFHNANSAFKKSIWKKYSFNNKTPHIEDRIWASLVIKKKYNIIYEPAASVFHWHGINQDMNKDRCEKVVRILEGLNLNGDTKNVHDLKKLNIIGMIPLRGTSLKINNNEIIEKTIQHLKASKYIKNIYVSTDNNLTKEIAKKYGASVPFLRPKQLSEPHVDIISIIKYSLEKLEEKKILPDLVVLMTENFPFRKKGIHDKMLKKLVDNDYDSLFVVKKEKGSIFSNNKLLIDGTVPKKIRENNILISRIGICTILRPNKIRYGSILDGKVGIFNLEDELSFLEVEKRNSSNISKAMKWLGKGS